MPIKFEIMQQNVLLEKLICKNSPFLPVVRVPCYSVHTQKISAKRRYYIRERIASYWYKPHTPKDSGCPISFPWLCPFPPTHLSSYPPPLTSLCTEMLHLSYVMFQHPPPLVQPLVMMTYMYCRMVAVHCMEQVKRDILM